MSEKIVIPGRPVPAQRMTHKSKWTKRARKSLDYQEQVAWTYKEQFGAKKHEGDLSVIANFYFADKRHGDVDNLIKSIMDGLQYAGAFNNDKQVKHAEGNIYFDEDERAEVIMQKLK